MFEYSQVTKVILDKAGWFEGRNVVIDELKKTLTDDAYTIFPVVDDFLKEFGYLQLHFALRNGDADLLHFNAKIATEDVDPLWAKENYYKRLDKKLCVIGQVYTNHMTLMMDIEGKVYGGFDDTLVFFGNSGKEAIEVICLNQEAKKIL